MSKRAAMVAEFNPKFYTAGPTRFYLPLLQDIVTLEKPELIVTFGFSDGQVHLAMCQIATENSLSCRIVAVRRAADNESAEQDPTWTHGLNASANSYSAVSELLDGDSENLARRFDDHSIDVLLIDDTDAGEVIQRELASFRKKLAANALVLVHGIDLERVDSPGAAWASFVRKKAHIEFHEGLGLGIATEPAAVASSAFRRSLFARGQQEANAIHYRLRARALMTRAELARVRHRVQVLDTRQILLEAVMNDRTKAQGVMEGQAQALAELEKRVNDSNADRRKAQSILEEQARALAEQARTLAELKKRFDHLTTDRQKAQNLIEEQSAQVQEIAKRFAILQSDREQAQTIMESQAAQILNLQKQTTDLKKLINAAKTACRKKGRCFDFPKVPKPKRSTGEKIRREIARVPRNLRRLLRVTPAGGAAVVSAPVSGDERYANWIAEHEPTRQQLEVQRTESATWDVRPKISLLIPIFDTPRKFLDDLFESIAVQSYGNWEACVVDGGSRSKETVATLKRWAKKEARIRVERLSRNLGVAENTNRALRRASGDVVAFVDHDDTVAPFALYEVAAAVRRHPTADFFYSDEDRLSESGVRSRPFFKPEWSPELLYSFMYTGHLSAYRRGFALALGGLRKEFDLSQDYDFALRASERARGIVHIPHVLYHWREHAASGASGGKPHARQTNLAALEDAMNRRGLDAEVLEYPTANRVRMRLKNSPRVSVIIPTDSPIHLQKCARDLPQQTDYSEREFIIVTNSSLIGGLQASTGPLPPEVRFVAFDAPFNFSTKCNVGAKEATGERLIFLNDDVESKGRDWIENVIEPLENPEVGAVSPKLLYSTGRIQHAGLVTGVRGLIGTAMHQWDADSVAYSNFAQSMRDVSALSAACLAVRRDVFFEVGGFDETNTPIAHSDIDFCFKIRETGRRCVYTPFTSLTHHGHASIGAEEAKNDHPAPDKCSIFLLQRWAAFTCRDPYFTDHMRDWLYADSPMPTQMFAARNCEPTASKRDLLFVTHDLSLSGAPIILSHLAKWCMASGIFVTVMSPADGPVRAALVEAGIPVIIDSVIATGYDQFIKFGRRSLSRSHESFSKFARNFDCLIASTIFGAPLIYDARAESIAHFWWIHEGLVGDHFIRRFPILARTLALAQFVVTPDRHSREIFQPFVRVPIRVLRYGVPDIRPVRDLVRKPGPLRFLLLGTIEHRKGQETLLRALDRLPRPILEQTLFQIVGRPHDVKIAAQVRAAKSSYLHFSESISHEEAMALIGQADVMICASRDETGPLTLIEAMVFGKPILSTRVGTVADNLIPEEEGLFVEPGDVDGLVAAITRLVSEPELRQKLAANSRRAYEKYFTLDRFGNEFLDLVDEAISAHKFNQASVAGTMAVSLP
jgi:glycosyltransferase involved in cell wall biosynthesis/GT2 family glycosyltransferase